jgi:hypothetical protein
LHVCQDLGDQRLAGALGVARVVGRRVGPDAVLQVGAERGLQRGRDRWQRGGERVLEERGPASLVVVDGQEGLAAGQWEALLGGVDAQEAHPEVPQRAHGHGVPVVDLLFGGARDRAGAAQSEPGVPDGQPRNGELLDGVGHRIPRSRGALTVARSCAR